jgi:hypothetical protein
MQHREPLSLSDQHGNRYFVESFGHHFFQAEVGQPFKPKQFTASTNG